MSILITTPSPYDPGIIEVLISISESLLINIGTLDQIFINAVQLAQKEAKKKNIPIIFDPVGAGASSYRTQSARSILETGINILKGKYFGHRYLKGIVIPSCQIGMGESEFRLQRKVHEGKGSGRFIYN